MTLNVVARLSVNSSDADVGVAMAAERMVAAATCGTGVFKKTCWLLPTCDVVDTYLLYLLDPPVPSFNAVVTRVLQFLMALLREFQTPWDTEDFGLGSIGSDGMVGLDWIGLGWVMLDLI